MEELSLLEKLQILFDNIIAHPFFLIILMVPMVVMFLERDTTKKEKDVKKIILLIYIIVIAVVLFIGGSTLFDLFDNVVNGFFMTLYFPNFITLFVVIILSAIICLITVFYKKLVKVVRIINFTGFAIVQTLFCLVLVTIQSNDINIYRENALYSNSDVLTLMQLLMGVFLLQIVSVCVITIINRITEMLDEKDNILKDEKISNEDIINEEINEKKANKNVVLEAKLISLDELSKKEKPEILDINPKETAVPLLEEKSSVSLVKEPETLEINEVKEELKSEVKDNKKTFINKNIVNSKEKLPVKKDNIFNSKPDLMKPMETLKKEVIKEVPKPSVFTEIPNIKSDSKAKIKPVVTESPKVIEKVPEVKPVVTEAPKVIEKVPEVKPVVTEAPKVIEKVPEAKPMVTEAPKVIEKVPEVKPVVTEAPKVIEKVPEAKPVVTEAPKVMEKVPEVKPVVTEAPKVIEKVPEVKPIVTEAPKIKEPKVKVIPKPQDLRNVVLTIRNLRILKTRKTIKDSRHMRYYKKRIIRNREFHPITNLEIIDFDLMLKVLNNKVKKIHTNRN